MTSHSQPVQPGASGSVAIVGNHYQVGKKIGEGSFGVVFEGTNLLNGHIIAIKFEPRKSDAPQLRDEYRSYRILQGCPGIPQAYYYGTEGLHNVLCIDLLGPNLEDLFDLCGRKFAVKTVAMLAKQMIERVQSIHEKNLIYRDIKPDNFLVGLPQTRNSDTIFMVDFGMAKLWRDPRTRQHIPYRERKSLSGTARYMSINTHLGREQSRRDDLEGLGHVFMYFLRGSLPWQGLKAANNKQKYERIGERKQSVPIAELCDGYPEEFSIYLNYVRKLGFEETPDYEFLKELFVKVLRSASDTDDSMYDWKLLNQGKGWEANAKLPSNLLPQVALAHQASQNGHHRHSRTALRSSSAGMPQNLAGGTSGNAASPTAPPAALARHASKTRKHTSGGALANISNSNAGSTGLLVGSERGGNRASRAMSPMQVASGLSAVQASNTGSSPHPYASAMHASAPYAGVSSPSSPNGGANANGGYQRNSVMNGAGSRQASTNNLRSPQNGVQARGNVGGMQAAEERDLPEPPRKSALMDILRCRCG